MASAAESVEMLREVIEELEGVIGGAQGPIPAYVANMIRALEGCPGELSSADSQAVCRVLRPLLIHRIARYRPLALRACRKAMRGRPGLLALFWSLRFDIPVIRSMEVRGMDEAGRS